MIDIQIVIFTKEFFRENGHEWVAQWDIQRVGDNLYTSFWQLCWIDKKGRFVPVSRMDDLRLYEKNATLLPVGLKIPTKFKQFGKIVPSDEVLSKIKLSFGLLRDKGA